MNIKISNRLVELRKKNGYSQEQLAEKLGLSRQAVSKWERAEASPDTDNLICLAKLYNVSLDELLSTDEEDIKTIIKDNQEKEESNNKTVYESDGDQVIIDKDHIHIKDKNGDQVYIKGAYINKLLSTDKEDIKTIIKDNQENEEVNDTKVYESDGDKVIVGKGYIHIKDKNGDEINIGRKKNKVVDIAYAVCFPLFILAYIILGVFLENGWSYYWPIILSAIVIPSLIDAILRKKITRFIYPVFVTEVYCYLGMRYSLWHPWWFLFITIPVFYCCFNPIDKLIHKDEDDDDDDYDDEDED